MISSYPIFSVGSFKWKWTVLPSIRTSIPLVQLIRAQQPTSSALFSSDCVNYSVVVHSLYGSVQKHSSILPKGSQAAKDWSSYQPSKPGLSILKQLYSSTSAASCETWTLLCVPGCGGKPGSPECLWIRLCWTVGRLAYNVQILLIKLIYLYCTTALWIS